VQVPTNQQRREAAKRKLERQLARRAERAKKRRIIATALTVGGVVLVVGLIYLLVVLNSGDSTDTATDTSTEPTPPPAETTTGPCKYQKTPDQPASKPVDWPADPDPTPNAGTAKVTLKTNQGEIPMTLDRSKAPCGTQAIEHLAKAKFFDGTPCHRLVNSAGLKVLQCGDPTGTGSGGPGFATKKENPTTLAPAPDGQQVIYPKGTIAMAAAPGADVTGSQFFLVYGDSTLAADYPIIGTVDAAGLATIDKVVAGGITPGQNGPEDGSPKSAVNIETAAVS
jgi:peptidyl-prolyl cis-trans isomerase B (cyclophilin B)